MTGHNHLPTSIASAMVLLVVVHQGCAPRNAPAPHSGKVPTATAGKENGQAPQATIPTVNERSAERDDVATPDIVRVSTSVKSITAADDTALQDYARAVDNLLQSLPCMQAESLSEADLLFDFQLALASTNPNERFKFSNTLYCWDAREQILLAVLKSRGGSGYLKDARLEQEFRSTLELFNTIAFSRINDRDCIELTNDKRNFLAATRPPGSVSTRRVVLDFGSDRFTEFEWGRIRFETYLYDQLFQAKWEVAQPGSKAIGIIRIRWEKTILKNYYINGASGQILNVTVSVLPMGTKAAPYFQQAVLAQSPPSFKSFDNPTDLTADGWYDNMLEERLVDQVVVALEEVASGNADHPSTVESDVEPLTEQDQVIPAVEESASESSSTEGPSTSEMRHGFRTWISSSGTSLDARLVKYGAGIVTLQTRELKTIDVELSKLSEQDKEYVQSLLP